MARSRRLRDRGNARPGRRVRTGRPRPGPARRDGGQGPGPGDARTRHPASPSSPRTYRARSRSPWCAPTWRAPRGCGTPGRWTSGCSTRATTRRPGRSAPSWACTTSPASACPSGTWTRGRTRPGPSTATATPGSPSTVTLRLLRLRGHRPRPAARLPGADARATSVTRTPPSSSARCTGTRRATDEQFPSTR